MDMPLGLLDAMNEVIRNENRETRRAEARAKARKSI
jgi:hypothetical protein